MIIYEIKNTLNGKKYVGQTKSSLKSRVRQHINYGSDIGKAMEEFGEHCFEFRILESELPKEQANEKELFWILELDTINPSGYNKAYVATRYGSFNGFFGKTHTEESIRKGLLKQPDRKRVICVDTGEVFESIREAARATESNRHMVSRVCRGLAERTNMLRFQYFG